MNQLPPRVMFFGGLIGGVLVLCTVGFFILLGMVLSGSGISLGSGGGDKVAAEPSAPSAPDGAGQPSFNKPASVSGDDHVRGNKDAKVTLIEYSDLQCPFCQRFHSVAKQLVDQSGGKVRWVYRSYPLSQIHPLAQKSAEASECVASLKGNDAYWNFVDAVFAGQSGLSEAMLLDTGAKIGVNRSALDNCLKSGKFTARVAATQADGDKSGVQGTPATFVMAADGSFEVIPGALPYEAAKAYVDRALAK